MSEEQREVLETGLLSMGRGIMTNEGLERVEREKEPIHISHYFSGDCIDAMMHILRSSLNWERELWTFHEVP